MEQGDEFELRDGTTWVFEKNSGNIAIGKNNGKTLCLFKTLTYRMDNTDHDKDVIKKVE